MRARIWSFLPSQLEPQSEMNTEARVLDAELAGHIEPDGAHGSVIPNADADAMEEANIIEVVEGVPNVVKPCHTPVLRIARSTSRLPTRRCRPPTTLPAASFGPRD